MKQKQNLKDETDLKNNFQNISQQCILWFNGNYNLVSLSGFAFNILCSYLLQHIDSASETLVSYIRRSSKGETRRFIFSKNIKKTCEGIAVNLLLISKSAEKKNTYSSDSDFPSPYSWYIAAG